MFCLSIRKKYGSVLKIFKTRCFAYFAQALQL